MKRISTLPATSNSVAYVIIKRTMIAGAISLALIFSGCGGGGGVSVAGDNQGTDPGTVEYPIAYVQRPAPTQPIPTNQQNNLQNPFDFHPGAKLLTRSRADGNAPEVNITDALFPGQEDLYDVKDLAVSPDGKQLVFALHAPMIPNADPIDQPSWDIWVYDFATKQIAPVIASKNKSEGSDVAPHFLDDGRIVFVSDRQQTSRGQLTSAGSPAYSGLVEPPANPRVKAGVLHIMNNDGSNIDQISFNQSHELSPAQMRNGKLVFTRWDNMNGNNRMNLYTVNPSGMNLSLLYGYNSHRTGNDPNTDVQFSNPREMEDGRLVTILRPYRAASMGGDLVAIDTAHFSDDAEPTWENSTLSGPAQQSLAANPVHTDNTLSPGGEFGAVWPLFDGTGRLLISWSQCRYLDSNNTPLPCSASTPTNSLPAPLLYGIWIFDPKAQTQKPIVTPKEGVIFTDIVAASPAKAITQATDNLAGGGANDLLDYGNTILNTLDTNGTAVLDIRSVYNLDDGVGNFGQAAPANMIANQTNPANAAYQTRRARFLQIIQAVPIPDKDDKIPAGNNQVLDVPDFAFGVNGNYLRHIVGYVPIEADGSVAVQVPANVPLTFNILDANAQSISAGHKVWWQFRSGEVVRCTGCHDANTPAKQMLTHGRFDSSAPNSNSGTASNGFFAGVSASDVNFTGNRAGQTMAEVYARNKQQPRLPSLNVYFADEWAFNPAQKNTTLDYRYITENPARPRQVPITPVTSEVGCLENPTTPLTPHWNTSCRIVIDYPDHIQPVWDKARFVDNAGNAFLDNANNPVDNRCTNCHVAPWVVNGVNQPPAGQLQLSSTLNGKVMMSYDQLMTARNKVDANGADILVPLFNPDGSPMLDGQGVQLQGPVTINSIMVAGNARASTGFFGCMLQNNCHPANGDTPPATVDHTKLLTKGELRLLSEWLDIGAQYYNDVVKAAAAQ